jgi:hypothetical protein
VLTLLQELPSFANIKGLCGLELTCGVCTGRETLHLARGQISWQRA